MILSFAAFIGVPDFGLSERGFVDVARQEFAPLLIERDGAGAFACRCAAPDSDIHRLADSIALQ
jgi:adenine deaminase